MPNSSVIGWRTALSAITTSGALRPVGPRAALSIARAYHSYGRSLGLLVAVSAARHPDRIALIDDLGAVTYRDLVRRSETIAGALHAIDPRLRSIGILCRNHRGFAEAVIAGSRLGCELVFLNTELPPVQLARILERHRPEALIHDDEFLGALTETGYTGTRVRAWCEPDTESALPTLDQLARQRHSAPPPVRRPVRITLLTSGTTGMAKGVGRNVGLRPALEAAASLAAASRLRRQDVVVVAPPFFHGFGVAALAGQLALGATVIARRRFDPEITLADIERYRATVFIGVPVMIQRLTAVPDDIRRRYRTGSLRLALTGAAPIPPAVIAAFLRDFGPLLNGYGSTEAGVVALATPDDLAYSPKTVGRPIIGVSVRVLRADRTPAATEETGAIFVRGGIGFSGYTADPTGSAPTKEIVDGYVNTGDMGHLDTHGRLYIDGRDDEMIVSGGENIYPREVENALAEHPAVTDVTVIGIPDPEYGQVLRAYIVTGATEPADDELKQHVRDRLERYKTPKQFIRLAEIPRNPSGKVLRHRLDDHPAPRQDRP
ncbi:AMP-binding protein [Nocardia acidivorans]|uniref:AMP-binding protein n=1 Tax=Nocardia acidivorans TaxID=404580 RepID=UPI00082974E0|nr:AMP-binding protein [Nocardia acidivorans]